MSHYSNAIGEARAQQREQTQRENEELFTWIKAHCYRASYRNGAICILEIEHNGVRIRVMTGAVKGSTTATRGGILTLEDQLNEALTIGKKALT